MTRIVVPTLGPSDWRRLLADPARQWVKGRSALELAVAWEAARKTKRGLPMSVASLFDSHPEFQDAALLLAIPEHQVQLDGGGHASQTDLWALLKVPSGLLSMAVEAKAGEGFEKSVEEWLATASERSGKPARLRQLAKVLGLGDTVPPTIRYQLLHRTASALIEADRFGAKSALLLIQSFRSDPESSDAFAAFCGLLQCSCKPGVVHPGPKLGDVQLYLAWLDCEASEKEQLAAAI